MNILDIAVIAFVLIITLLSAKKGFLISVFNIAAYIISGVASKIFSGPLSNYLYANHINKRIISELYEIMPSGSIEGELSAVLGNVFDSLPPFIKTFAEEFSFNPEFIADQGSGVYSAELIEAEYLMPIITNIMSIVVFVLLFLIFSVILKIVLHFINNMLVSKKHKIMRSGNAFLGALFGFVKGLIPAGLICALFNITAPFLQNGEFTSVVSTSYFCKIIADLLS